MVSSIINFFASNLTQIIAKFYSFKYPSLIVRKRTSDEAVFRDIFLFREYDISFDFVPEYIIDAGANVGYFSVLYSSKFPNAKIIAIEPESSNFEVLTKNIEKFPNVHAVNAGLWPTSTFLKVVDLQKTGNWGFVVKEVSNSEKYDVKTVTVSELLERYNFDRIDILKIDIEGAEKELFSENYESWLGKVRVIIIELHDYMREGAADNFYLAIRKYNWKKIRRGPNFIFIRV